VNCQLVNGHNLRNFAGDTRFTFADALRFPQENYRCALDCFDVEFRSVVNDLACENTNPATARCRPVSLGLQIYAYCGFFVVGLL
jgi:hypothetical protein